MRRSILITATAMAVFLTAAPPEASADKRYYHPSVDFRITLMPDGSAEIEETRVFDFDGSFSWAFLEKDTRGKYGYYGVEYEGVWDAVTGERLESELYDKGSLKGIKWYYRARSEKRRFLIKYRISEAVQRYVDAAQFYWKIIGESHESISEIRAVLVPPQPSPRLFKIFVHTQSHPGSLDFAEDFSEASVRLSGIRSDEFVELRVLLDPDIFPGAPRLSGESHGTLLEDERATTEAWREARDRRIERHARSVALMKYGAVSGGAVLMLFIGLYIWFFIRYGREPDTGYDHDYEREPPSDIPPCVLPAALTQSGAQDTEMGKAFASALIECARLGYLEMTETEKKTLLFRKKGLEYTLTEKGKRLYGGSYIPAGGERALLPFEIDVVRTVFGEAGDGRKATSEEIEKWARKSSGMKTNYRKFMDRHKKKLRSWYEDRYFPIDDPASERARKGFILISFVLSLLFVVLYFAGLRTPLIFGFIPVVIILGVLLSIPLARRTREAALDYEKWKAFKRFMSDFSAMKEAGPSLIPMWEHYLVYAVALGVASKLIKNLRLVSEAHSTPVPMAVWFHPAHVSSFGPEGAPGGISSLESMGASLANLEALASAMSTSTSSGGGFSGGGGGGGGGGGSGAG